MNAIDKSQFQHGAGAVPAAPVNLVEACAQTYSRWYSRRQDDVRALLDFNAAVGSGLGSGGDSRGQSASPQLVQRWLDWQAGSLRRLTQDCQDQMSLAATMGQLLMSNPFRLSAFKGVIDRPPTEQRGASAADMRTRKVA